MAPGSTTLLVGLAPTETAPGAMTDAVDGLTIPDEGSRDVGSPRVVDEDHARRLTGRVHPRAVGVRRDVARFAAEARLLPFASSRDGLVVHDDVSALFYATGRQGSERESRWSGSLSLIENIFGGARGKDDGSLRTRVARANSSSGPEIFSGRGGQLRFERAKSPEPVVSRVIDMGGGELIANPLGDASFLQQISVAAFPGKPKPIDEPANLPVLEIITEADIQEVAQILTSLYPQIVESVDIIAGRAQRNLIDEKGNNVATTQAAEIITKAQVNLKRNFEQATQTVIRFLAKVREDIGTRIGEDDFAALRVLSGYGLLLPNRRGSFFGFGTGSFMTVTDLIVFLRDQVLSVPATQRRESAIERSFDVASANATGFAGMTLRGEGPAFPGVIPDARSARADERRDDAVEASDASAISGPTASAGADADADDQGQGRDDQDQ